MGVKLSPVVRLYVAPLNFDGAGDMPPHYITDNLDTLSIPKATRTNPHTDRRTDVREQEGMRWWDITDDENGLRVSGFTLEPQLIPRNTMFPPDPAPAPPAVAPQPFVPPAAYGDLMFRKARGDYWATVLPDYEPKTAAIKWYSSDPTAGFFAACSEKSLPDRQSFAMQLQTFGYALPGTASWLTISWGMHIGIRLQAGHSAQLVRQRNIDGVKTNEVLRELPVPADRFSDATPTWIYVHHVGGRLVLEMHQGRNKTTAVWAPYVERTSARLDDNARSTMEMQDAGVQVGHGPIWVEGEGVPFTLRVHELGHPATGSFKREFSGAPSTTPDGFVGAMGYSNNPRREPGVVATGGSYNCSMTKGASVPQDDSWAMGGSMSDFVTSCVVGWQGRRKVNKVVALLLTPAMVDWTVEHGDPVILPGSTMTVKVDRQLLPLCPTISYDEDGNEFVGEPVGDAWPTYLAKYHRARLHVSWQHDDGQVYVVLGDGNRYPSAQIFDGVVWAFNSDLPGYAQNITEVSFRDQSVRLQKPAGLVDARFAPADVLFAQKLRTSSRKPTLYGWEIVRYILATTMGDTVAASLDLGYAPTHYTLIDYALYTNPSFQSGFFWPPPWGQSAMDWIKQFCDVDFGIFYWGPDRSNPSHAWVPHYADYFDLVKDSATLTLRDYVEIPNDPDQINALAQGMGWQDEPTLDYNRVLVWGQLPGDPGYQDALMPRLPLMTGSAVIKGADTDIPEQRADLTWERTLLKQGKHFCMPWICQYVAKWSAQLLEGLHPRRHKFRTRGEPFAWWGLKLRLRTGGPQSDPAMYEDETELRIMRVVHHGDMQRNTWDTDLVCAPLPSFLKSI